MEAESVKSLLTQSLAEELLEFLDHLRTSGFDVGVRQYLLAQDALVALAANGQLPCEPERLRNWLAPIICSSPKEQEAFYSEYSVWLDQHPGLKAAHSSPLDGSKPKLPNGNIRQSGWSKLWALPKKPLNCCKFFCSDSLQGWKTIFWAKPKLWIILASVLFVAACALITFYILQIQSFPTELPQPPRTLTGIIVNNFGGPVADASVSSSETTTDSDETGQFSITFDPQAHEKIELTVSHNEYEPEKLALNTKDFIPLIVELKKATRQTIQQSVEATSISPEDAARLSEIIERINKLASNSAYLEEVEGWEWFYLRYYRWIRSVLAVVPLFCFGIWWLVRKYRRRLSLKKWASEIEPQIDRLTIRNVGSQLFSGELFRRTVQKFRLHGEVISSELDAPSTIDVTIKQGGWFKPVYGLRNALPEYLAIVDHASFNDQQARFADAILDRLVEGGVFVHRYYFDGDPRSCRKKDPKSRGLSLADLAAKYPDHRLVVFSDGAGFLDPLTQRPKQFLEMFSFWKDKAVFTPQSPAHWGYREWVLAGSEFMVLPATEAGLAAFVETIHTGVAAKANGSNNARRFPEMLKDESVRWLLRDDPGPRVKDRLSAQLRHYLGEDGYYWLSACAVYPALQWDITLFLGYMLAGAKGRLLDEGLLLSLVRLPWFRHGTMPDWLRLRLVADLSLRSEQSIRDALEQMLLSVLEHPKEGAQLEIAREIDKRLSRRRKKKLKEFLSALPDDSPLREHVFLSLMSGHRLSKTTVRLPQVLRRFFFKEGIRIFGPRPAAVAVMASIIAVAGWVMMTQFKPKPSTTSLIPSFTYVSEGEEQSEPFVGSVFGRSDRALSEYSDLLIRRSADSLGSLIQHYLPNYSALQTDTLLEDNSASFQLRSDLYKEWLKETLKEAGIDAAAYRIYATRFSESSDWKRRLLYLTPSPSPIAIAQPEPPPTQPGIRRPRNIEAPQGNPPRGGSRGGGGAGDRNGSLRLRLVDVLGSNIYGRASVRLRHQVLNDAQVFNDLDASKRINIPNLFGAPQGLYRLDVDPSDFLPTSRFVTIKSGDVTDVEITCVIDPKNVRSVVFPEYSKLPAGTRRVLENSQMLQLEGKRGEDLYNALDDLRKAHFLNIAAKSEATLLSDGRSVLYYVQKLVELRGDRVFVIVTNELRQAAKDSAVSGLLNPAPDTLHTPPPGYSRASSFKTIDRYGRLQLTFFTNGKDYMADIDMDPGGGIDNLFSAVGVVSHPDRGGTVTHPYSIRETLIFYQKIDPGYRFIY